MLRKVPQVGLLALVLGVVLYTPAEGRSQPIRNTRFGDNDNGEKLRAMPYNKMGNNKPYYGNSNDEGKPPFGNNQMKDRGKPPYGNEDGNYDSGMSDSSGMPDSNVLKGMLAQYAKLMGGNNITQNLGGGMSQLADVLKQRGISIEEYVKNMQNKGSKHWTDTGAHWNKHINDMMANVTNATETLHNISDTADQMMKFGDKMKHWYKKGRHDMSKYGKHEMHHFGMMKHMLKALVCKVNEISSRIVAMQAQQDYMFMKIKQMAGKGMHGGVMMEIMHKMKSMSHEKRVKFMKELEYMKDLRKAKGWGDSGEVEQRWLKELFDRYSGSDESSDESDWDDTEDETYDTYEDETEDDDTEETDETDEETDETDETDEETEETDETDETGGTDETGDDKDETRDPNDPGRDRSDNYPRDGDTGSNYDDYRDPNDNNNDYRGPNDNNNGYPEQPPPDEPPPPPRGGDNEPDARSYTNNRNNNQNQGQPNLPAWLRNSLGKRNRG